MGLSARPSNPAKLRRKHDRTEVATTCEIDPRLRSIAAALGRFAARQYYEQTCFEEEKRSESEG